MSFSLSDLQPDREPFDLGDGRTIYFRTTRDFDLTQFAAWKRLSQTMTSLHKQREKAGHSEEMHQRISEKVRVASLEIVNLGLPDIPADILSGLTVGQIDQLAAICIGVISGMHRNGAASLEQRAAILARYDNLPDEFVDSLSARQAALLLVEEEVQEAEKN